MQSLALLSLLCVSCVTSLQIADLNAVRNAFANHVKDIVGTGDRISTEDVNNYFSEKGFDLSDNSTVQQCFQKGNIDTDCLFSTCLTAEDMFELSGERSFPESTYLTTLATIILHISNNDDNCTMTHDADVTSVPDHSRPSMGQVWGFGMLCTALVSACSLTGVFVVPCMKGETYKKVLIYMVGLAVGTLAGSSLLFLIPEALELTDQELNVHSYVWKCLTVIVAIFFFFNVERTLRIITERTQRGGKFDLKNRPKHATLDLSSFHLAGPVTDLKNSNDLIVPSIRAHEENGAPISLHGSREMTNTNNHHETGSLIEQETHHHYHGHSHGTVEPVAWMIIFGDGLHNLIDGVSIGAAFTESILAGVSVSVAILCEELPHEMGDFAVLLNAGMSIKKAFFYNFISACVCFVGLVIGIFLGENEATHTWVFALAAGMFLYISLVDMMPEMGNAADVEENKKINHKTIYILQNLGMLTGFGLMLLLAVYGGALEEAITGGH